MKGACLLVLVLFGALVCADVARLKKEWALSFADDCATAPLDDLCGGSSFSAFDIGHHNYLSVVDGRGIHFWRTSGGQLTRLGTFPTTCPMNFAFVAGDDVVFTHDQSPLCSTTCSSGSACEGIISGLLTNGQVLHDITESDNAPRVSNLYPSTTTITSWVVSDPENACAPLKNAAAVQGKWLLVRRGACSFNAKVSNAVAAGAAGVFIQNFPNTALITMALRVHSIPVVMVDNSVGEDMRSGVVHSITLGGNVGTHAPASPAMGLLTINIDDIVNAREEEQEDEDSSSSSSSAKIITEFKSTNRHLANVRTWYFDEHESIFYATERDSGVFKAFHISSALDSQGYFGSPEGFLYMGMLSMPPDTYRTLIEADAGEFFGHRGSRFLAISVLYDQEVSIWSFEDTSSPIFVNSHWARDPALLTVYENRYAWFAHGFFAAEPNVLFGIDLHSGIESDIISITSVIHHSYATTGAMLQGTRMCRDRLWSAHSSQGFDVHSVAEPLHPVLLGRVDVTPSLDGIYYLGAQRIDSWPSDCSRAVGSWTDEDGLFHIGGLAL